MQCRICLEDGDHTTLLSPCNCRGTASYIHQACLDRYIQYYPDRICRVCNTVFNYESPEEIGFCYLLFIALTAILFLSKAVIVVKFSLFATIVILSLYLLRLKLIGTSLLTAIAILAIIFFPGGHRDAIQVYIVVLGTIAFVYTLSQQMSAIMLLGLVVTTMVAIYSAFFIFLAYHALDPPAFTVLISVYFMAWYGWIHTRLRLT